MLAEQGLGGRADTQTLLELVIAAVGDPRTLRREALYMVGLLLEQAFGMKIGIATFSWPVSLNMVSSVC